MCESSRNGAVMAKHEKKPPLSEEIPMSEPNVNIPLSKTNEKERYFEL